MHTDLGAYDAKTKLPELLRGVEKGNTYTITKHGVAVADLIPTQSKQKADATDAIAQLLAMASSAKSAISDDELDELRSEGRK